MPTHFYKSLKSLFIPRVQSLAGINPRAADVTLFIHSVDDDGGDDDGEKGGLEGVELADGMV